MTHLPYMRWWPACAAAKTNESPHYQQHDRPPAIQLDYTFTCTTGTRGEPTGHQTILTLIDVRSLLATAIIVPQNRMNHYAVA